MPHRTCFLALALACLMLSIGWVSAASAQADADYEEHAEQRERQRIDRLWNRMWREVAPYYLEHDGRYVCVPGYDRRVPSSAGLSIDRYQDESAWEQAFTDERGRERSRRLVKPDAEAHAAVAVVQAIEVGQYGFIHSGHLARVIDGQTVQLNQVWLLDADAAKAERDELKANVLRGVFEDIDDAIRDRGRRERRNRGDGIARRRAAENEAIDWAFEDRTAAALRQRNRDFSRYRWEIVGYRTDRLEAGLRWPTGRAAEEGLQLVIVEVSGTTVTAVPAATIGRGLDELAFLNMLEQRGMTKAQFVELVNDARRDDREEYLPRVLTELEGTDPEEAPADSPNDSVELAE